MKMCYFTYNNEQTLSLYILCNYNKSTLLSNLIHFYDIQILKDFYEMYEDDILFYFNFFLSMVEYIDKKFQYECRCLQKKLPLQLFNFFVSLLFMTDLTVLTTFFLNYETGDNRTELVFTVKIKNRL